MNSQQYVAGRDPGSGFGDLIKTDPMVNRIAGVVATSPKADGGAADRSGIDPGQHAAAVRPQIGDDRRGIAAGKGIEIATLLGM